MSKNNIQSVEEKLKDLYRLQLIDSKIDRIRSLQGELPLEVEDLKNTTEDLKDEMENNTKEVENVEEKIKGKEVFIEECKDLLKKYEEQHKNVRNNREYNSLSKEIEYQELESQIAERQIRELGDDLKEVKSVLKNTKKDLKKIKTHLKIKKEELENISSETAKEEKNITNISQGLRDKMEKNILEKYLKIRERVKNKLAVVPIERNTAVGVYFTIPTQIQIDVASRSKIIHDEYTGRILVDAQLAEEIKQEVEQMISL